MLNQDVCQTVSKAKSTDDVNINLLSNHTEVVMTTQDERKTNTDVFDDNVDTKLSPSYSKVTMLNRSVSETVSKDVPADDVNINLSSNHSEAATSDQDEYKSYNPDTSITDVVTKLPSNYREVTMLNQGVCETASKDVPADDVNTKLPSNHSETAMISQDKHKTFKRSCFMNKLRHYSLSLIGYYKDE